MLWKELFNCGFDLSSWLMCIFLLEKWCEKNCSHSYKLSDFKLSPFQTTHNAFLTNFLCNKMCLIDQNIWHTVWNKLRMIFQAHTRCNSNSGNQLIWIYKGIFNPLLAFHNHSNFITVPHFFKEQRKVVFSAKVCNLIENMPSTDCG